MHCPYHPTCPGCAFAGVDYAEQLSRKGARLAEALSLYPHLGLLAPPVLPAERTEGYRHRVKLPVARGEPVAIGLYARDGGRVVDTPGCPVLEPGLREGLAALRPALRGHAEVHALDLRRSADSGRLQLVLACQGGEFRGGHRAAGALLRAVPGLASVAVSRADPEGKRVMGASPRVVAGDPFLAERIDEARYRLHPGAFFQVDPQQAGRLHALVREYVGGARTVADLYCGVGAYALSLAPGRARVVAVEEVAAAARSAREAAPRNVEVVEASVEDWARGVKDRFDVAILNPARRGSSPAALAAVARVATRAVYVSCGPETLARDLDHLAALGLRVDAMSAIDLFPQTPEVETVVSLVRGPALVSWNTASGVARGPWTGEPSGATGRPARALVLALGDTGDHGTLGPGRFRRIGVVATHSLLRVDLAGPLVPFLAALAREGHPVAAHDPRTSRFFAEKAGLQRPFVHVEATASGRAPLHGDLVSALRALGATEAVLARAGATAARNAPGAPSRPSPPARRGGSRRRP